MIGMDAASGAAIEGADHLRQSIADILDTPLGTRIARREYGSILPELLDQPMNDLGRIRLFAATALALMRQEGRARLERVALLPGDTPGAWRLQITGKRTDIAAPARFDFALPIRALSALAA